MVEGLPTVEGKQALSTRALGGHVGRVECLQEREEEAMDRLDAQVQKKSRFVKYSERRTSGWQVSRA